MKKRTSKSASGTRKASSPFGMFAEMAATGNLPRTEFSDTYDKIMQQTPEETLQALIRAGIITETGELTDHYKIKPEPKPKRKSKKKSPKK